MKTVYLVLCPFFFILTTSFLQAEEINNTKCAKALKIYCTRCHTTERICVGLNNNSPQRWHEIITEMAEYDGDLDQQVQGTVKTCLQTMPSGDPIVCTKK